MTSRHVRALVAFAIFSSLSGCGDPPPEKTAASATPATPSKADKSAELSSQMVAAVSSGKTASAIGVHFALGDAPTVGKPLPVQIALVPHQKFATLSAHFEGYEGLGVPVGTDFGPVKDVEPEKTISHQLMLLPTKEGMFMVTVSVDSISEEGNVVRIFSIPVVVGTPGTPAASPPK